MRDNSDAQYRHYPLMADEDVGAKRKSTPIAPKGSERSGEG